jgi:nickel-dependent lactate racemase
MIRIDLPYGKGIIRLLVPEDELLGIIRPNSLPPVQDEQEAILSAIEHPVSCPSLSALARKGSQIVILVDDITRPTPTRTMLIPLLEKLHKLGIKNETIRIVFATGAHRKHTLEEQKFLLGEDVVRTIEVIDHDARDKLSLVHLGCTSRGTPVELNRIVVDADLRIMLGLIKPHNEAGYSGGGKSLVPGVAGLATIMVNHGYESVFDANAVLGVINGNPIREDIEEVTGMLGPCFIVNAVINPEKRIIGVVAGDVVKAHRRGVEILDQMVKVRVPQPGNVVIVSCAYPVDICLYQAINALVCPVRVRKPIIKKGGIIILTAQCPEGIGHRAFYELLANAESPQALLEKMSSPDFFEEDQYAAQVWAQVLTMANVIVVTEGVSKEELSRLHVESAASVEEALQRAREKISSQLEILVMPDAAYTIPVLENE